MATKVKDGQGDFLRVRSERAGITIETKQVDDEGTHYAIVGPLDPKELITAIRAEMGWDVDPEMSPTVEAVAEQINGGELKVDGPAEPELTYEEALARKGRGDRTPTVQDALTAASTAQAQADAALRKAEQLQESADTPAAHGHLSDYWARRLDVVEAALAMLPAPAKRGGILEAFAGADAEQPERVEKALKIARFATEDHRDIPGVDA